MITIVILAVVNLVEVVGTIIVRILGLALTIGIIVDIAVIAAGAVMTVVGTILFIFPDGADVRFNPACPGPRKPAGANERLA